MADTAPNKSDIEAITDDIAALRRDLKALMEHVKSGAVDAAAAAVAAKERAKEQVGEEATQLYAKLAAEGTRTAEAFARQVEHQPLASLLIAFGLGFIGGRILSR